MAKISAALVKELRERTGAGMMDCKKALVETDGELEAAAEYLMKKGIAKAAKKAGRIAAEGLVAIRRTDDLSAAVLIEVNCETDFVARNDGFQDFVAKAADFALASGAADIDALLAAEIADGKSVDDWTKEHIASIGENINIRRIARIEAGAGNVVGQYIHMGSQIGVVVPVTVDGASADDADAFAQDIAMHVAASNPTYTRVEDIDDAAREKQREIFTAQALESGKPANIVDKMVVGRVRKWAAEVTLAEQPYVKNPDLTVAAYEKSNKGIRIQGFARFQVGEGIEKQQSNLAEEVAAQLKG